MKNFHQLCNDKTTNPTPFLEMTITEFTDIFLPTLSLQYYRGELDLHGLVDVDTWRKVFPDNNKSKNGFLWYQISLNAFPLNDGSCLIVYSMPHPDKPGGRKFVGIRFDNKSHDIHYYILVRPKIFDMTWEIHKYSFSNRKFTYECLIDGTDSLRDFVHTIETLSSNQSKGLFDTVKDVIFGAFQMQ